MLIESSEQLRTLTGNYYANNDFAKVQGDIDQATEELAEFMAAFQKFAMTIPARMAGAMSGYADAITIRNAQKAIRKELETMLTAYVDAMQAEDPPEAVP